MYVIREIWFCKPGKVRPMIEKYGKIAALSEKAGWGKLRYMTDIAADRYWTLVAELEVEKLDDFMSMDMSTHEAKEMEKIMEGYHELIEHGRREIYKLEG